MEYTREQKMALCRKLNENIWNGKDEFEGFALKDKIALAEWQVQVLNGNSKLQSVRDSYKKWEILLIELRRQEVIEEATEILTSKGRVNGIITGDKKDMIRKICYKCKGTGINLTRNSNICNCCNGKGYTVTRKPKELTLTDYKESLIIRAYNKSNEKRLLTRIPIEEMSIEELENFVENSK